MRDNHPKSICGECRRLRVALGLLILLASSCRPSSKDARAPSQRDDPTTQLAAAQSPDPSTSGEDIPLGQDFTPWGKGIPELRDRTRTIAPNPVKLDPLPLDSVAYTEDESV